MGVIVVNGKERELESSTSLMEFLSSLQVDPKRVVVELNGDILARDSYQDVVLRPGDRLEVVHFVGGGSN